jgi:fumarate reductase subunit C
MLIVVFFGWLAFTVIVAVAANTRGRNALWWGILALLFSPLLIGLLLLALPNRRMETLMFGEVAPSGPILTQEQIERRRMIARGAVAALVAIVVAVKLVDAVFPSNTVPAATTTETTVVKTIEENGKPIVNAAIKKNR